MTITRTMVATALCFGMGLAGCSNRADDVLLYSAIKGTLKGEGKPTRTQPAQLVGEITQAMEVIDGPLAVVSFEKSQTTAVIRVVETNGAYRTWANWGSSERRSVTTRNGLIVATRGLGHDLMSSDVDDTLNLVSRREAGHAKRVQRYLDGNNTIVAIEADCTIQKGGATEVQMGVGKRAAVEMIESCDAGDRSFRNIYKVASDGRILQSNQWLGEPFGQVVLQHLR